MDFKTFFITEGIDEKLPILVKQFPDVLFGKSAHIDPATKMADNMREFKEIAALADPTYPRADYITWILKMIASKSITSSGEDFDKVHDRLSQFDRLKKTARFTSPKDILKYESFANLAMILDRYEGVVSKGQQRRTAEGNGTELVKRMGNWALWRVTTPEAAAAAFRHTDWCVKDPKYFDQYAEQYKDPNFYMVEHHGLPSHLGHFGSDQLKNVHDDTLEKEEPGIIQELIKLFSDLPEYIELKQKHAAGPADESTVGSPAEIFVDSCIDSLMSDPQDYFSIKVAKRILKTPDFAKKIIAQMLKEQHFASGAEDYAHDGDADVDDSGTEFAPLLNADGLPDVQMWAMSYRDEPGIFKEEVLDYLDTFTPEKIDELALRLYTAVKATSLTKFDEEDPGYTLGI